MAISNFNPAENVQYSGYSQEKLSDRNRFLIETLLADSGIYYGAVAAPTPTPTPPTAPAPSPTPSPAPAPTPSPSQAGTTVNTFVRLALSEVKPGDLITAGFANNLIEAIMALEARVKALEGGSGTTPTPTPTQPTPTPSGPETSLSGGGRSEIGRAAPTIESVTGETVRGKGVDIAVTGDNLGEGVLERVLLGTTTIAPRLIKFTRTGFTFTTTAAIVKNARNRITVVTSGGEDSAAIASGKKAPVL
ncbi:hypothetical protein RZN05_05005 [Sphingomonas sp. HF-S4]|uniref:IPT/TIG domain-containing protein n=1 Tax=Sphingomonas agrestis TaxID=3080540 RepID=A0ABU3Y4J8_9SPHN|nr:hypothetical protein [Sphingomonas sp. HF-S4]MDV3456333.1 hypothetical protein [Sphingomonas sp. HF-S4]